MPEPATPAQAHRLAFALHQIKNDSFRNFFDSITIINESFVTLQHLKGYRAQEHTRLIYMAGGIEDKLSGTEEHKRHKQQKWPQAYTSA
ncbi:hypothetical protein [Pontibacter diazotrophicus]|uniref:hypothetical protein n=1 Tax=Pontibacter diazotrophicus TaxID=1400979 RepID=UPI0011C02F88|nr:hypothetical protein [Pontibacter diazotrophicus]